MACRRIWLQIFVCVALVGALAWSVTGETTAQAQSKEEDIVASLQSLTGRVQVVQKMNGESVTARAGLLLRTGDTIVTAEQARATIKFRDGSEIRLFQNTRFVIQGSKETAGADRSIKLDLLLRAGALWGNFQKQRQTASLKTPTATIGVKGTTLRVSDDGTKAKVAITEGVIDVSNDAKTLELSEGKRLTEFTRSEDLSQKVKDIPYKLDIKADKRALTFEQNRPETVFVNLQMIDVATKREVARSAKIYFRSNYEHASFPVDAKLDERGFARVVLNFGVPQAADEALSGNVFVWAVVDQEDGDDTGEGRALFTIPVPAGRDRIRIDADKGETKRVN